MICKGLISLGNQQTNNQQPPPPGRGYQMRKQPKSFYLINHSISGLKERKPIRKNQKIYEAFSENQGTRHKIKNSREGLIHSKRNKCKYFIGDRRIGEHNHSEVQLGIIF